MKCCNGCGLQGWIFRNCIPGCICMCFHQSTCFWGRPSTNDDDWALVTLRLVCKCQRTDLVVSNLPLLKELKVAEMSAVRVEFSGIWHSQLTCNFLFASIHLLLRQTKYCKTFENFHSVTKAGFWESRVSSNGNGRFPWTHFFDRLKSTTRQVWPAVEIDTSNLDVYKETVFQSPASSLNQDQYLFLRGDHVPWLLLSDLYVLELLQANNTATISTTTTKHKVL